MGKVKRVRAAQLTIQSYVSIPYGKGKALKDPEGAVVHSYQFPMGKVKAPEKLKQISALFVSIPYGKGKVGILCFVLMIVFMYQFPMGKVKRRNLSMLLLIFLSINSLWER